MEMKLLFKILISNIFYVFYLFKINTRFWMFIDPMVTSDCDGISNLTGISNMVAYHPILNYDYKINHVNITDTFDAYIYLDAVK